MKKLNKGILYFFSLLFFMAFCSNVLAEEQYEITAHIIDVWQGCFIKGTVNFPTSQLDYFICGVNNVESRGNNGMREDFAVA